MKRYFLFALVLVVLAAALAPEAWAQGCSMCAKNAAAASPEGQRALNYGILILLAPTLLLFIGAFVLQIGRAHV